MWMFWLLSWVVELWDFPLPLGAFHKSMVVWDSVEERMLKRLALWKRVISPKEGGKP